MASVPSYVDEEDAAMLFFDSVEMNDASTYFPPSPPPSSMQQGCFLMMPHAPSPSHHMDPMSSSAMPLVAKPPLAKSASSSSPLSAVKAQKLTAAKQLLSLDEVEREILRHNAHLPPEAKRKMAKAEFKRLKHCETVRQSRVRKKVCQVAYLSIEVRLWGAHVVCVECRRLYRPSGRICVR
jgi:hypothetical protein